MNDETAPMEKKKHPIIGVEGKGKRWGKPQEGGGGSLDKVDKGNARESDGQWRASVLLPLFKKKKSRRQRKTIFREKGQLPPVTDKGSKGRIRRVTGEASKNFLKIFLRLSTRVGVKDSLVGGGEGGGGGGGEWAKGVHPIVPKSFHRWLKIRKRKGLDHRCIMPSEKTGRSMQGLAQGPATRQREIRSNAVGIYHLSNKGIS